MGMFADMAEQHPLLSMSTRFVDHSQFTIKERARLLSTDVLISVWVRDYAASRFVPRVCAWGVCVNLSICRADADHQGDLFYQSNSWTPDYSGMPVAYDWAVANGPPMPTETSALKWDSIVPWISQPQLTSPPSGGISHANEPPWCEC